MVAKTLPFLLVFFDVQILQLLTILQLLQILPKSVTRGSGISIYAAGGGGLVGWCVGWRGGAKTKNRNPKDVAEKNIFSDKKKDFISSAGRH